MFALEENKILQATPPKLRREMGMCAIIIYVRIRTAVLYVRVLVRTSSLEPLVVPGAAYLVPGTVHAKAPNRLQNQRYGVCLARRNSLRAGTTSLRCITSREQRRLPHATEKAKRSFPWNVDPLRSTTLVRGLRSARSGLGQRSFRSSVQNRKSCHALVSVMLEKRGDGCRTDGPIRVLSCQMRHTIDAIKAAWCHSLR